MTLDMKQTTCTTNPELPDNIIAVHESALMPDPQFTRRPLEWFIGKTVKMAFQSSDSRPEHMWVFVDGIEQHHLVGRLDNHPVSVTHLKWGDRVSLSRTQVEKVSGRSEGTVVDSI